MMRVIREAQVAVIGAGAIGCSIAYHLANRGADVTVIEGGTIGSGASTANHGLVWVQGKEPAEYMELNLQSSLLHASLAPLFDNDVDLRQPGGLIICLDEEQMQQEKDALARLKAGSDKYMARILSPSELREMEPQATDRAVGAIYSPHDGNVNPNKLVFGLANLATKKGARFLHHTSARRILTYSGTIKGVETAEGIIRSEAVVVAAGTGSSALVEPLGISLPLKFDRGQILVTEQVKPFLNHPTDIIWQTREGNILIGSTHEDAGLDVSTTVDAARKLATNAKYCFPGLEDVLVIRQYAGIRPMPKDGKPFLGPVKRVPGLFVAVSHSGITLCPVHGKVISELLMDGKTDVPISLYDPERFTERPKTR